MQVLQAKCGIIFWYFVLSVMLINVSTCAFKKHEHQNRPIKRYAGTRLQHSVYPQHYNISFLYDQTDNIIGGTCSIDIVIIAETPFIQLHVQNLDILNSIKLSDAKGNTYNNIALVHSNDTNILELHFENLLSTGNYNLFISYQYPHFLQEQEAVVAIEFPLRNRKRYSFLATNIRTIEARQLFPCWDEPRFQATFEFNLRSYQNTLRQYSRIFWPQNSTENNMEQKDDGTHEIQSRLTFPHPIPTSNVMFIIISAHLVFSNLPVSNSIWSRPNVTEYMKFANSVLSKIQESKWHTVIPKDVTAIDQLAIPSLQDDFIGNENLLVYRESLITYDEKHDVSYRKREIADAITRAVIRQSINNAIKLSWWSDLWVNEGLAGLLQMEILNETFPEWRISDLLVVQLLHESLRLDTECYMKPLTYKIDTPSEIKSMSPYSLYVKAPVIFRMLQSLAGRKFPTTVDIYLTLYLFHSITSQHFWRLLQDMSLKRYSSALNYGNFDEIMDSWITTNGYPIIHVVRDGRKLTLLRFPHYDDCYDTTEKLNYNNIWLPITYTRRKDILINKIDMIDLDSYENVKGDIYLDEDDDWIIINKNQIGYYRVLYDNTSLWEITQYLKAYRYRIDVINRAQIIDDTYYFWQKGMLQISTFLEVTSCLKAETDYIAWYPMYQIFRDISPFIPFTESESLKAHMRDILSTLLEKIFYIETNKEEDDYDKWLRQETMRWACSFGDTTCFQTAYNLLEDQLNHPKFTMPRPGWKEWTYCNGLLVANVSVVQKLENLLFTHNDTLFNYALCPNLSSAAVSVLYDTVGKKNHSTFVLYKIYAAYFTEQLDRIPKTTVLPKYKFQSHKTKMICIIINKLYSIKKLRELVPIVEAIVEDEVFRAILLSKIYKRLNQINSLKQVYMKAYVYTYIDML